MIDHSGEDDPVLGDPPTLPDEVWSRAVDHALDPWAVPDSSSVPSEDLLWSAADDAVGHDADGSHDGNDADTSSEHSDHVTLDHVHELGISADSDTLPSADTDTEPDAHPDTTDAP